MKKSYLILYPSCLVVKGAKRSTISDVEKGDFHYIPNDLADVIEHLKSNSYNEFISSLSKEDAETIEEYIKFLRENDLAFFTEKPDLFPSINLQFFPPSKIANAILDRDQTSNYDLIAAINELNKLNCRHLQIRFYSECEIDFLNQLLSHIQKTDILSVEIFLKYKGDNLSHLKSFINKWTKIKLLLVHSAPFSKVFILNKKNYYTSNMGNFIYTDELISSEQNCGCISFSYFTVNVSTFAESLNHNTCLKNKLSVDVHGNIKNCPTLKENYGKIGERPFQEVLNDEKYLFYGEIKKDQIAICKDCEHRHFCTDCRAFIESPFDKPAKCTYNPYTAQWYDTGKEVSAFCD